MAETPRTAIVGLDGVPYNLMEDLSDRDIMPNFRELRKEGIFTRMRSSIPEVSAVSWSSIITGKNPGEHGVYGFTELIDGSYTVSFHNSSKLKAPTFWQIDEFKRYIVINLPATYPAKRINGILITGFVSPDLEKAVYPRTYIKTLKKIGYRIDIDAEKARISRLILFKQLFETLDTRMKICMELLSKMNWDLMFVVFTGTDRLGHFLWDAYEDESHEQHQEFLEYFKRIDEAIGNINSKLNEDDNLIILSDHGMEKISVNVNVNTYLIQEGYLRIEDNPKRGYNNIKRETKAFAMEPSRIYLNRKGRYPRGSVTEEEEEGLLQDLKDLFYRVKWRGEKVVKGVYRKEEIYKGEYVHQAPDLVLVPNEGFNLRAGLLRKEPFEVNHEFTGKHTQDNAFLYVKGTEADEIIMSNPRVEDVLHILWALERMKD
jgi:predicted AlkP superfamily phosphohydrolase/phosphomutase